MRIERMEYRVVVFNKRNEMQDEADIPAGGSIVIRFRSTWTLTWRGAIIGVYDTPRGLTMSLTGTNVLMIHEVAHPDTDTDGNTPSTNESVSPKGYVHWSDGL